MYQTRRMDACRSDKHPDPTVRKGDQVRKDQRWLASMCALSICELLETPFWCIEQGYKSWEYRGPDRNRLCKKCREEGDLHGELRPCDGCTLLPMYKWNTQQPTLMQVTQLYLDYGESVKQLLWLSVSELCRPAGASIPKLGEPLGSC